VATPRRAARARARSRAHSGAIAARRVLAPGRSALVLRGLRRGVTYTLRLTVKDAEGDTATSTATLRVAR
jgi:hypothetical protein